MTPNVRLCCDCRGRFSPTRPDQHRCGACESESEELHRVRVYLRTHPEDPLTRVSVATGVSEHEISRLARDGLLPVVPRGAEPTPTCSCDGGARCPVCKAKLARRIARAVGTPSPPLDTRVSGMRSRRPGAR